MPELDINNLPTTEEEIDFTDLEEKFSEKLLEETLDNVVLIDCLPIVDENKESKLFSLVKKITKNIGKILEDGIHMPKESVDGKSLSKGYAFVEFETPEQARNAVVTLNGYKLDKSHTLAVNLFMDVEKYSKVPETFTAPPKPDYTPKEHFKSWLLDEQARDQFCMHFDQDLSVNWNNRGSSYENIISRKSWTETYFQWSTFGLFLTTLHRQGAVLWGGPSFEKIVRFIHLNVKLIDFSPKENYLVTFSGDPINLEAVDAVLGFGNEHLNPFTDSDVGNNFCIWEIKTGRLLKTFPYTMKSDDTPVTKFSWPCFKWAPSENYIARMTPGSKISIYQVSDMSLLGKKSLQVPDIASFDWQPEDASKPKSKKQDILAYWIPEIDLQPGRIVIISVPDYNILRTKNVVGLKDITLHWHPTGQVLCARIQKYTKTKKSTFSVLEIFRLNAKDISSDIVEFKDNVVAFAWDPRSPSYKFAIIHVADPTPPKMTPAGMATTTVKSNVSFYHFVRTRTKISNKEEFVLLKTVDSKNITSINWSPKGRYVVLSTLRTTTAWGLEFWDTDAETQTSNKAITNESSIELLNSGEHYGVTDIEWDPTGRYVVTSASTWRHTMENGFAIWDFKGDQLSKNVIDRFKQILCRPRPPTLLTDAAKNKIRKNLEVYSKDFDEQDRIMESAASIEQLNKRRRMFSEWCSWRKRITAKIEELAKNLSISEYYIHQPDTIEHEIIEEIVEEVIEERVEYV
ncbi:hypothetical protein BB561_001043 [Smittium simulii]|uniref:Eukaryotic translation initiation factor 3 subunit B n=1 Tax=Smittium simulii TaxID=133385 RepID=A0A2T9YWI1_9FUNG|nr:hypothetical protein BB561_001043 [Smittium simulii]